MIMLSGKKENQFTISKHALKREILEAHELARDIKPAYNLDQRIKDAQQLDLASQGKACRICANNSCYCEYDYCQKTDICEDCGAKIEEFELTKEQEDEIWTCRGLYSEDYCTNPKFKNGHA